ncbi:MAG: DUF2202 domain-containing protein [Candidatus Nanopelagicales bacterium]
MSRIAKTAVAVAAAGVMGLGSVATAASAIALGNGAGQGAGQQVAACDGSGNQQGNGSGRAYGNGAGRGAGNRGAGNQGAATHAPDVPAAVPGATISTQVAKELAYMVQEEKLARDVYALAKSRYSDRVFTNINRAETNHMAELRVLLDRYDVKDPTAGVAAGKFADKDLQALYDKLAAQVKKSRDEAVKAGITVETTDIADLKDALKLKAPSDVTTVLKNLLAGSQRHLAAFQRNA